MAPGYAGVAVHAAVAAYVADNVVGIVVRHVAVVAYAVADNVVGIVVVRVVVYAPAVIVDCIVTADLYVVAHLHADAPLPDLFLPRAVAVDAIVVDLLNLCLRQVC